MAFVSLKSVANKRNRSGNRYSPANGLTFSTDIRKEKGKKSGFSIRFRIGVDLSQSARLIAGDRVDIFFDSETKTGLIKRVSKGGWKLAKNGSSKTSLSCKIAWSTGMPSIAETAVCEHVTVENDGILFAFPENTSFNGQARN